MCEVSEGSELNATSGPSNSALLRLAEDMRLVLGRVEVALGGLPSHDPQQVPLHYGRTAVDAAQDRIRSLFTLIAGKDLSLVSIVCRSVIESSANVCWVLRGDDEAESVSRLTSFVVTDLKHEEAQLSKIAQDVSVGEITARLELLRRLLGTLEKVDSTGAAAKVEMLISADSTGLGGMLYGALSRELHGSYFDLVQSAHRKKRGTEILNAIVVVRLALAAHVMAVKALLCRQGGASTLTAMDGIGAELSDLFVVAVEQIALGRFTIGYLSWAEQAVEAREGLTH